LEAKLSDEAQVDRLYRSILTRPPSGEELSATGAYLKDAENRREALEDLAWSLLNAKEFLLRR
jgi:hypothetical protein